MIMYACVFALGYASGVIVGAFQYGVRAITKVVEATSHE